MVTTEGVNLRSAPTTNQNNVVSTVNVGSSVSVISHDPAGWSRVRVGGAEGFIRSDFLTLPAGHAPATFVTTGGVNLRSAPNRSADVIRTINVDLEVEVLSHNPTGWSNVRINGTVGFVNSEFLRFSAISTPAEASPAPAPANGANGSNGNGSNGSAAQSAPAPANAQPIGTLQTVGGVNLRSRPTTDGNIVRVLNAGTRVEVLSNGSNGWSSVRVGNSTGYIRSDLLGEVSGPGRIELLTMAQVRPLMRSGQDIRITDVRTGRTFNVRPFSFGRHADVDTSSRADTDTKLSIRDGRWSWSARPVWVHIGDRTIAASINGMPHDVTMIPSNGAGGHFCLHFHGTVTNNQRYQADLRNAIMEAYNAGRR